MSKRSQNSFIVMLFFVPLVFLYQNCGGGFKVVSDQNALSSQQANNPLPEPTPSPSNPLEPNPQPGPQLPLPSPLPPAQPMPMPGPGPIPQPGSNPSKSNVYFARPGAIEMFQLDHAKAELVSKGSVPNQNDKSGWLYFDLKTNTILAPDSLSSNHLAIFNYNASTGALSSRNVLNNFIPRVDHLAVLPTGNDYLLFASSYVDANLGFYRLSGNLNSGQTLQNVGFSSGAKTHSSSYDAKRKLLYIANLGLDKIAVYRVTETALTALTEIAVADPRTVIYDSTFDKIFVSTESMSGPSYIRIFSIQASGNSYTFQDAGSQAMPMIASDLKVNHKYRYVMSAAREAGKETIWGLPITETGIADKSRQSFSIPIPQKMPRCLELTADGQFIVVGSQVGDTSNVVAYKMNFDSSLRFVSSQKIYEQKIGAQGFMSGLSIPVP